MFYSLFLEITGWYGSILDFHVGHVSSEAQNNILLVLLWAPANVGEKHCVVCPERSQELVSTVSYCTETCG